MPYPATVVSVSSASSSMPLLPSETIIFRTRPNFIIPLSFILLVWVVGVLFWWFFLQTGIIDLPLLISSTVLEIIVISIFGFVGLVIFLSWLKTEYILTNKRVEWRFGIIGQGVISIALANIENISLIVSIIGRLFNFGNLIIEPAGLTTSIRFGGISDPRSKKEQIEQAIS